MVSRVEVNMACHASAHKWGATEESGAENGPDPSPNRRFVRFGMATDENSA
jgi:hypothetical protein